MATRRAGRLLVLVLLLFLVGCDHATKGVAKAELETGGPIELVRGLLSLRYVENTDIAFNLLRWIPESIRFPLLVVVGGVAVAALCVVLFHAHANAKVSLPLPSLREACTPREYETPVSA